MLRPLEALEKCIEAALFVEPLKRMGPGQVVLLMSERNAGIKKALEKLSSDDLINLRPDYAMRWN